MSPMVLGIASGVAFGTLAVVLMLPLKFADRRSAMMAAFASRFAIGFLIPLCNLPAPWAVTGALVGLLVSLPDAIVTKAFAPIIGVGVVGGTLIGLLAGRLLP